MKPLTTRKVEGELPERDGDASSPKAAGVPAGALGVLLLTHQRLIESIAGTGGIVMGLAYAGAVPLGRRERRLDLAPKVGLVGAPLLGIVIAGSRVRSVRTRR